MSSSDLLGYRDATAVVVGCSTGIGAATARLLHEFGARVHAVGRNEPSVSHERFHHLDLTDPVAISATAAVLNDIGPIDHLFVCAGVPMTRPPREVLHVNYFGVRHLVELVEPSIVDGGAIGIVSSNTASGWEARLPALLDLLHESHHANGSAWCDAHPELLTNGFATYVMAKQAVIAWAIRWSSSLACRRRIRVNCTLPGPTDTPMVDEIAAEIGSEAFESYPHPVLGHIPTAEQQAWPLLLLSSRLNRVVTGTALLCDEGVSTGRMNGEIDLTSMKSG